jgi:hypothetical protein
LRGSAEKNGEEWEKFPKYSCATLVSSHPRKIEAVITAKGASTK